jgi:hypothetical protein
MLENNNTALADAFIEVMRKRDPRLEFVELADIHRALLDRTDCAIKSPRELIKPRTREKYGICFMFNPHGKGGQYLGMWSDYVDWLNGKMFKDISYIPEAFKGQKPAVNSDAAKKRFLTGKI